MASGVDPDRLVESVNSIELVLSGERPRRLRDEARVGDGPRPRRTTTTIALVGR